MNENAVHVAQRRLVQLAAELDIDAASRHVRRDRHGPERARLRDNHAFFVMLARIENLRTDPAFDRRQEARVLALGQLEFGKEKRLIFRIVRVQRDAQLARERPDIVRADRFDRLAEGVELLEK